MKKRLARLLISIYYFTVVAGAGLSAEASSARSQKKILRAFFCFTRYATMRPSARQAGAVAGSNLLRHTKKKRPPNGNRFFLVAGAGFEPATLWL